MLNSSLELYPYLDAVWFTKVYDHKSFQQLVAKHDPSGTTARWHLWLVEHGYQINHKPE